MAAREDESVRVVVQARPLLHGEEARGVVHIGEGRGVRLVKSPGTGGVDCGQGGVVGGCDDFGPYTEARDAGGSEGVKELYGAHVREVVQGLFDGLNGTVMAYGQTASGKTWTMDRIGGMVFDDIWELVKGRSKDKNVTVRVGCVEIYQESIRDLIDAGERGKKGGPVRICVRTRRNGTVFLDGAKEVVVRNAFEMQRIVAKGASARKTAATGMNAASSRSHSIITISVQQEPFEGKPAAAGAAGFLSAKLHLVDLAGSERTKRCTANGGARFAEGVSINTGLLSLAKVISALADRAVHVPYRESNLTRLLQDSLGGNSRSLVLACVSPAVSSREETASTLRYAMRIKNIRNKPRVNVDPASVENSDLRAALARAKNEIVRLKKEIDTLRRSGYGGLRPGTRASLVGSPTGLKAAVVSEQSGPVMNLGSEASEATAAAVVSPPRRMGSGDSAIRNRSAANRDPRSKPEKAIVDTQSRGISGSPPWPRVVKNSTGGGNIVRRGLSSEEGHWSVAAADRAAMGVAPLPAGSSASSASPPQSKPSLPSPATIIDAASIVSAPVTKDGRESESLGTDPKASPGSLMGRLVELEVMLQAPKRGRTGNRSRSVSPETSPLKPARLAGSAKGRVRASSLDTDAEKETAEARHNLPSPVKKEGPVVRKTRKSGGGRLSPAAEREARIRVTFEQKLSNLQKAKSAAEMSMKELEDKLTHIEREKAAEVASREAEHQACIAELRSLLAESQKREGKLKQKASTVSEHVDRQRLLRRLRSAEMVAAEASSKLADNAGKSDLSKANLLRENRSLSKQENMMRVRVRRLESIRARQAEQIRDLTEKERLVEIDRHQKKPRGATNVATKGARGASGASTSTITPKQKQMFLERELNAMSSRSRSETPEDLSSPEDGARNNAGDRARHWAWLRSMDDAKVVIKMCLVQLADARASTAAGSDVAAAGPKSHLGRVAEREERESGETEISKKVERPLAKEPQPRRSNAGYLAPRNAATPTPVG